MTDHPPLIAHIIHRLGIGGLENGLVNIINAMPPDRYRHAIICLAGYTDFAARIKRENIQIFDLEKAPGKDPGYYLRLFRLLRRLAPNIVHTRNIGTLDCQFVAAAAGVRHRIHGEHGWDVGDLHGRHRKHVLMRRLSRTVVGRYATVSRNISDWLENVIGIPEGKITQIYNGIDADRFRPDPEQAEGGAGNDRSFVVGTVGRLDPIKDQITLLRSFTALLTRIPDDGQVPQLVIAGAGEMQQPLEDFVERHGLSAHVSLEGACDDVPELLKTFDVFVLPSLNEGISNTILEAMASGLPVLATDVGGNPELVVDGVTGSLFAPGDSSDLTGLLEVCMANSEMRLAQGAAGRSRVIERFSMAKMISRYLQLYDIENGRQLGKGR